MAAAEQDGAGRADAAAGSEAPEAETTAERLDRLEADIAAAERAADIDEVERLSAVISKIAKARSGTSGE